MNNIQNLLIQIEQLTKHGIQDMNQVLPLLPQFENALRLQHEQIESLRAALTASQNNIERLNILINANNNLIAQLELDKNNLSNELARLRKELENIQTVNREIFQEFANMIFRQFQNELNLNTPRLMTELKPMFTSLDRSIISVKNDLLLQAF